MCILHIVFCTVCKYVLSICQNFFFCTVWSTLIRISLTKALVLWWCNNKSDLISFDLILQGDWAWLKRLPYGNFRSITPHTSDVFELVSFATVVVHWVVLILFVGHSVCVFFVHCCWLFIYHTINHTVALNIPDERYEAREYQPLSGILPWLWSVCHSNRVLFARQLGRSVAQRWRQTGLDVQVLSLSRPHQGAFLEMWLI